MARYTLTSQSASTGSGSADAATITGCVFFLGANASTMQARVNEVQSGGEATSGAVQILILARDSTNAATPTQTNTSNVLMDVFATAPGTTMVSTSGRTATTLPTRSANHLLQHSYNAYGGLVRWQARQGEEITIGTASAPNSEISYSSFTGNATASVSAHCIYELV
jgi:hypothetical protein